MITFPTNENGQHLLKNLTERECQVLTLSVQGRNSTEIGTELGIARATVETYKRLIRLKLCVKNERELTLMAVASGMLSLQATEKHLEILTQLQAA